MNLLSVWTLVISALLLHAAGANGQQQQQVSPLRGQGVPDGNVSNIYLSAFLDRLLSVDQVNYQFDAVVVVYVTWTNEPGIATFFRNNIATNCADVSRTDYDQGFCLEFRQLCMVVQNSTATAAEKQAVRERGAYILGADIDIPCQTYTEDGEAARTDCSRYCSNSYNTGDCCDDVFIPNIDVANIYELDQDFVDSHQLLPQYDYRKEKYGAWMWTVTFHAIYFNRMSFRGFPLKDKQQLFIQFIYSFDPDWNATSTLEQSSAGVLTLRPQRNGDDSSGWKVVGVHLERWAQPQDRLVRGQVTVPNPSDPIPLFQTAEVNGMRQVTGLEPIFRSRLDTPGANSGGSLLMIIQATRYYDYWLVNSIIPIILSTSLAFFVFLLPPEDLEKRLTLLVTLFLALTALQFVIGTGLPASSYVLRPQAMVLTGYSVFVILALESWLAFYLASAHERRTRKLLWRDAYKRWLKGEISSETMTGITVQHSLARTGGRKWLGIPASWHAGVSARPSLDGSQASVDPEAANGGSQGGIAPGSPLPKPSGSHNRSSSSSSAVTTSRVARTASTAAGAAGACCAPAPAVQPEVCAATPTATAHLHSPPAGHELHQHGWRRIWNLHAPARSDPLYGAWLAGRLDMW
eukprot:CAMPEP_0206136454 /NCGR_PEP_ID=MMETSP1473-20131121/1693_1 /ASSEMBLY_ACC=CAM_ASM_001109 /TAXON_ID=1461547 /ORGANISM="Stichococcus sp, Strain RCC1054" /LENGTH=632 /DNA_ID=CAMNT_0053529003 /DNA_START=68 /DNA_END=1963 /DNA_ORIENTATION=+